MATEIPALPTPGTITPKYRSLRDIYENTEPIDIVGDLYMMEVEEPTHFQEASKGEHWKNAMRDELEAIEKNST